MWMGSHYPLYISTGHNPDIIINIYGLNLWMVWNSKMKRCSNSYGFVDKNYIKIFKVYNSLPTFY